MDPRQQGELTGLRSLVAAMQAKEQTLIDSLVQLHVRRRAAAGEKARRRC